jgi:hypothetical protein
VMFAWQARLPELLPELTKRIKKLEEQAG